MEETTVRRTERGRNRLALEMSPYLQQHADNPVDWHPWGEEAFEKAREEGKPIFLSIGYSSCHWCHVMEEESFEDDKVAEVLNRHFVSIKVDREERPDLDSTYMTAAQLLSNGGGWPLTLVLTPDKRPFFAATYLPKEPKMGMPGLINILNTLAQFWNERRGEIEVTSTKVVEAIRSLGTESSGGDMGEEALMGAFQRSSAQFDRRFGGFGGAPKFPIPHRLTFLLRYWHRSGDIEAREMAVRTLRQMRRGGIYDQLGGGFHRYSTDQAWTVPHFEKMLYDQALLIIACVEAWQATNDEEFKLTARETIDYVLKELTSPRGGFYSAEDADSEGEEGKFYVWTLEELSEMLSEPELSLAKERLGVSKAGNMREGPQGHTAGKNVLQLSGPPGDPELRPVLEKLREARAERPRPFKDEKIMADWNGLMMVAMARAYGAWRDEAHGRAARKAAEFVLNEMMDGGVLHHVSKDGVAKVRGFLDDYAFCAWGLLELYMSDPESRWLGQGKAMVDEMIARFWDSDAGGFFTTAPDTPDVIHRSKDVYDGAIPSGNSVALLDLVLLGRLTGQAEYLEKAERTVTAFSGAVFRSPENYAQFLNGLDMLLGPYRSIVLAGDREGAEPFLRELGQLYCPNRAVVLNDPRDQNIKALSSLVEERPPRKGMTAYVCTEKACLPETSEPREMVRQLKEA